MSQDEFTITTADYQGDGDALRRVREVVFVQEQQVPIELEHDELDVSSFHVIARDHIGHAIGTGRLTPEHKIGRMAVIPDWRGRGVGEALLAALLGQAKAREIASVSLHAQVSAETFYARNGFIPVDGRFQEAGIEHQTMQRMLVGGTPAENTAAALAALTGLAHQARGTLHLYCPRLDPGLLDRPAALDQLRQFATRPHRSEIQVLLHDAAVPHSAPSPLLMLARRLSSIFLIREVSEPEDRTFPSAFIVNDTGGYYFRPIAQRMAGETRLDSPGRARQLGDEFNRVWQRSRPCSEYRALGI